MKKFYILAALALMSVSCAKQVPVAQTGPESPISFSPISQKMGTKAKYYGEQNTTYTGAGSTYEDFTAWAYFTKENSATTNPLTNTTAAAGSSFFAEEKAVYDNTYDAWKLYNTAYWPKAGYLHFHAFSPNALTPATGTLTHVWGSATTPKGFTLTDYVAPVYIDADDEVTASNQIDLLYSDFVYNKQRSQYTPEAGVAYDDKAADAASHKGVDLTFRHALAAVQFKIKTAADYTTGTHTHAFTVKKIEVLKALNKGTFVENRAATLDNAYANAVGANAITKNKDNSATTSPYWTPDYAAANEKDYTVYFDATGTVADDDLSDQIGTTILAVPQALSHPGLSNVKVKVTYDYTFTLNGQDYSYTGLTSEINLNGMHAARYSGGTEDYTVNNWLINHKYIYVLNFKLDEIIFDPKVEAFVEVDNIEVDLPAQN